MNREVRRANATRPSRAFRESCQSGCLDGFSEKGAGVVHFALKGVGRGYVTEVQAAHK